jgi:hypothetical protein
MVVSGGMASAEQAIAVPPGGIPDLNRREP